MTVFCLVELDGGAVDGGAAGVADVSLRAITLARGLAPARLTLGTGRRGRRGRVRAVRRRAERSRRSARLVADLAAYGVTDVYAVAGIDGYAPLAWARVLQGLLSESLIRKCGGGGGDRARQRGAGAPGRDHRAADGGELYTGCG